jgi:hypothetical protein
LPDAMNADGERFGEVRLREAIERYRAEPLRVGLGDLLGEISQWQGAERPQDDSSILAVELAAVPKPDGPNIQHRTGPQAAPTVAETALLAARASTGS